MNSFYKVIGYLKDQLALDIDVNTIIHGEAPENKKDIFPMAHLMVTNGALGQGVSIFTFTVQVLDIRNVSKKMSSDKFLKNDNELDNLNTCFAVLNRLIMDLKLQRNNLDIELLNEPSLLPVIYEFKDTLDGWSTELQLSITNTISVC
jgi:hypothetical protein